MNFGIAKEIITPNIKMQMAGYSSRLNKIFNGIHDDLYVKTLILIDNNNTAILLISIDLLFHDYGLTNKITEYVNEKYSIPKDNLILSYTHTHAGPAIEGYEPEQKVDYYESFLLERIKSCVDRAFINIFKGFICAGTLQGDWNINRRKNINGKICLLPDSDGIKDNDLNIFHISNDQGETKALILNYACHPVTLGDTLWLSAEYPGRLCQLLENNFYGSTAFFFQGAGANTRPRISALSNGWRSCNFAQLDDMATSMANSIRKKIYSNDLKQVDLNLAAKHFIVSLDIETFPKDVFAKIASDKTNLSMSRKAQYVLDTYDQTKNSLDVNAGIIRLNNDLYIAFLCGEACFEIKQHIQKVFGKKKVIFIGYGDSIAYIPDDKILYEGGYEADGAIVEFCLKGKFKSGIDKKIKDAYSENLQLI